MNLKAVLAGADLSGTDPTANGTITFDASATDSTAIVLHNQGHATKLVTLDHVLPTTVPHSDIVWH